MPLGMVVGLGPVDILLDGDPSFPPKEVQPTNFSTHVYCGQTARWIKIPLGVEVYLGPGDVVLDGLPSTPPLKGAQPPVFGTCLLWPDCWMDGDANGTEVDLGPGHIVLDRTQLPHERGIAALPHIFGPSLLWPWSPISYC